MKKEKNFWVETDIDGLSVIANKVESYGTQRFKISILNTAFNCEKIKLSNADNRYYYNYIFSGGSEKISRTRSDCEYCLGTDNLIFAEKQIEKNIRAMNKKLRKNLKHPVMIKLSSEVKKHVKFYKTDFYHWDNWFITKDNMQKFIIVLKENGTYLFPLLSDRDYSFSNNETAYYMLKYDDNYKCFLCDMNTESVIAISVNDIANYIE